MGWRSVLLLWLAFASPSPSQTFEVASVRAADPKRPSAGTSGIRVTAGQFSAVRTQLKQLITTAFGTKAQLIEGPGWDAAGTAGSFDVEARLPEGTTPGQVPAMLRHVLEERFHLTWHAGTRVGDYYALVVGKDGIQFPAKVPAADDFSRFDWGVSGTLFQSGSTRTVENPPGVYRVEMSTLADVAALLDPHFDGVPVVNKTGLSGTYDIRLQYNTDNVAAARAEGRLTPQFAQELREQMRSGVISGVEKLGLRVEKRKGEIEILVIDHLDKSPTEN